MRFKQYLAESGGWITDKSEAVKWIVDHQHGYSHKMTEEHLTQVSNDVFSLNFNPVVIASNQWPVSLWSVSGKLRVKFKETADFRIEGPFYTLEGCPEITRGDFLAVSDNLTSFKYAPRIINGEATFSGLGLHSLEGIADIIEEINGTISLSLHIKSGGIGLLLIKGIKNILGPNPFSSNMHSPDVRVPANRSNYVAGWNKPWEAALSIIEKYLGRPEDIYECQAELIDAGLEEFAKL